MRARRKFKNKTQSFNVFDAHELLMLSHVEKSLEIYAKKANEMFLIFSSLLTTN